MRYIGCSNHAAWQVALSQETSARLNLNAFVSCQDEYSLLVRNVVEGQLDAAMKHYGMSLLPFFPLASGLLTGKYKRNAPMPQGARLTNTQRLADRYRHRRQLADRREAPGVRRQARPLAAGACLQLARGAARGGERHRRRHEARADRRQRQGGRLGADAGGDRRNRQDQPETSLMAKQRVGLIGLGMAVAPHAKSLLDLQDRVDVVAWSPSAHRRDTFGKAYPFALADGLDALLRRSDSSTPSPSCRRPTRTSSWCREPRPPASTSCWKNRWRSPRRGRKPSSTAPRKPA